MRARRHTTGPFASLVCARSFVSAWRWARLLDTNVSPTFQLACLAVGEDSGRAKQAKAVEQHSLSTYAEEQREQPIKRRRP